MGRDKALLTWRERPLVEHVADRIREAAGSAVLVGAPERYNGLPFLRLSDSYSNSGPLAGIEAALSSVHAAEYNLIVACDLPDLALDGGTFLADLLSQAKQSTSLCIAAQEPDGQVQPLCAVYRAACLPIVRECLREGVLRLTDVVKRLGGETRRTASVLANVNSPEDWHAWQTR